MAVTSNQLIKRRDGNKVAYPVAASQHIRQGTLVFGAGGYATGVTGSGANVFLGVAIHEADNSTGSAGDIKVEVWRCGEFELVGSGFTVADAGKEAFATDNYTIGVAAAANAVRIGKVTEFISATRLFVAVEGKGFTPQTALTAADASTVDGTYGTQEQNVIANNRTRIGEIEARLKNVGILPS